MAAIDLYSGIGGWTLGFRMAGINVLSSFEWWKDANLTHNKNFGSHHAETDIRQLDVRKDLPDPKLVDYVIGSPPCTQFSFANRGGTGDIKDGLIDILKFLEVVEYMQPRYWAMENVPRVAKILEQGLASRGKLSRFKYLFSDIRVYNSADYGVPQDRMRMIAGRLPFDLLDSYRTYISPIHMGAVLDALRPGRSRYIDPIYGLEIPAASLTDQVLEPNLSSEEARINEESKTHHPVYNRMSFPDRQDRPARTITALCTRVSRESIVIRDHAGNLRRLTVRERATIQSFPFNYQFFGSTYPNKLKMIGNAVPPLLTFYIAQSMQERSAKDLLDPHSVPRERLELSPEAGPRRDPGSEGASFPWSRSFWLAIKGLRFGSGVRFDLKNLHDKEHRTTSWRINFYYGSSKDIRNRALDRSLLETALRAVKNNELFDELVSELVMFLKNVDEQALQLHWTNIDRTRMGPIQLIDALAGYVLRFRSRLEDDEVTKRSIAAFMEGSFDKKELPKIADFSIDLFIGIIVGATFNLTMTGEQVRLARRRIRA
jgi:DNA (cytosine-5)-methyltransferase 1